MRVVLIEDVEGEEAVSPPEVDEGQAIVREPAFGQHRQNVVGQV